MCQLYRSIFTNLFFHNSVVFVGQTECIYAPFMVKFFLHFDNSVQMDHLTARGVLRKSGGANLVTAIPQSDYDDEPGDFRNTYRSSSVP